MSRQERRARHAALLARVKADTANGWAQRFLDDLESGTGLAEVGGSTAHELDLSGLSWGPVAQGAVRRNR
jgi:trehalose-6-phosphate synthase